MNLATLCYLRDENKTLFLYRNVKKHDVNEGFHIGVGGKVEAGETLDACIRREFIAETGLTIHDPTMKGFLEFDNEGAENWLVMTYIATQYSGTLKQSDEGILQWIDNSKINQLNLLEGDRLFLPYLFQQGFFHGVFKYKMEEGRRKLISHTFKTYKTK